MAARGDATTQPPSAKRPRSAHSERKTTAKAAAVSDGCDLQRTRDASACQRACSREGKTSNADNGMWPVSLNALLHD